MGTPLLEKAATSYGTTRGQLLKLCDSASVKARLAASDPATRATVVSATSGAVALGASAGATGLVAGGVAGAAIGVVPAIFTFGLSIPIGAAIGSGAGVVVGTTVGGVCGLVGGGAAGYSVKERKKITEKVGACKDYARSLTSRLPIPFVGA